MLEEGKASRCRKIIYVSTSALAITLKEKDTILKLSEMSNMCRTGNQFDLETIKRFMKMYIHLVKDVRQKLPISVLLHGKSKDVSQVMKIEKFKANYS